MEEVSRAARYDLTEAYTLVAPHALVPYKTHISCLHYFIYPPCRTVAAAAASLSPEGPKLSPKAEAVPALQGQGQWSGPVVRARARAWA